MNCNRAIILCFYVENLSLYNVTIILWLAALLLCDLVPVSSKRWKHKASTFCHLSAIGSNWSSFKEFLRWNRTAHHCTKISTPVTLPWDSSLLSLRWFFNGILLSALRYDWEFYSSRIWRCVVTQKCGFATLIRELFIVCRNSQIIHVAFHRHTVILRVAGKAQ
jgi:hypothetical protein